MSLIQDKIYPKMPLFMQNLMISVYGYHWQKRRFGGVFVSELKKFREREAYSAKEWKEYQTIELRKLLIHSFNTVPFYNKKYSEAGFSIADFKVFELNDLSKLPYLEKEELRQFGKSSLLSSKREFKGQFFASSGSMGTPINIFFSNAMHQRWSAGFEARIRNWAGLSRYNKRGMIGGRRVVPEGISKGPFYRYNFFEKQVYFSAYHISSETAPFYAEAIKKYKLDYMTGYAMSNFFLARFLKENNIKVPPLKAVITSSEKLTPEMREVFQEVYGCKTYDGYSGVEACGMITETEHGQLLISPDAGVMEVLKEDGSDCQPGEIGEIYSTGLLNFDQPLIRYRIGDMVKLSSNQNTKCGRNMTVVDEIIGRVEDTIIGQDGREIVRFHGIFINLPNVIKGQVIQNDYTHFELNIETKNGLTANEQATLKKRMQSQLGDINLKINQLRNIPSGPNGKFKSVISKIKKS